MRKVLPILAVIGLAPLPALAVPDVTIELGVGPLLRADGVTPLPQNSLMVLLADADGDGFGDPALGLLKADPGDVIIRTFGTNNGGGPGTYASSPIIFDETGLVNAPLLLAFYDKPFNAGDPLANPGPGVFFNTFRTDQVLNFSDSGWIVPGPGSFITLNFLGAIFDSNSPHTSAAFTTSQTTVPEPATAALLAAAVSGLVIRRRRRA